MNRRGFLKTLTAGLIIPKLPVAPVVPSAVVPPIQTAAGSYCLAGWIAHLPPDWRLAYLTKEEEW